MYNRDANNPRNPITKPTKLLQISMTRAPVHFDIHTHPFLVLKFVSRWLFFLNCIIKYSTCLYKRALCVCIFFFFLIKTRIEPNTVINCALPVKICLVVRQICPGATAGVGIHSDFPPFNIVFVYILYSAFYGT